MTQKIDDGGPAYPAEYFDPAVFANLRETEGHLDAKKLASGVSQGMSLRDYFAGQALPEVVQVIETATIGKDDVSLQAGLKTVGRMSYWIADAMIAARKAGAE